MSLKALGFLGGLAGSAMLVYGALYESKRLVLEAHTLALQHWPERLRGYKIAVIADLHLRDAHSLELAQRAIALGLDQSPDMVVLPGDLVGHWRPESPRLLGEALEPLLLMEGSAVAIPGNHEYWGGDASLMGPILAELGIKFLRNASWRHDGVTWVGVDSGNVGEANPFLALNEVGPGPKIALWHEPDFVDYLPLGCDLMISGHSHGGQFVLPGGFVPMKTVHGERHLGGFYPSARTPLYVSRGVGTTGPPSRFLCPPEVSLLTLVPQQSH